MAEHALVVPLPGLGTDLVGVGDDLPPHVTVAQRSLDELAVQVEPLLPPHSRAESVVLYDETAQPGHWAEVATFDL